MKPFKFLSNSFLQHEQDMKHYLEGYEEANQDIESDMWYNWSQKCEYVSGTREFEMWGQGYQDRYHLHTTGTPRL
jgi:hypothetical protein